MKLKLQFLIAAVFVLAFYIPAVKAQANLIFEGGNNSPLKITLQQSVTYTINNSNCAANGPLFVFDDAGDPFQGLFQPVTGTITFFINGGTAQPITTAASGSTTGIISPDDIFISGGQNTVSNGNMIVLNAGTVMTINNITAAAPANGSYTTFITDGNGTLCSNNGIATVVTAASVSVSGRVLTNGKRSLSNAVVYLTDSQGNTRTARTNSLGYYRFNDIAAGQSVTITVVSKRFQFAPQVVNVNEEMSGLNFLAEQ
ncbi:MAG TPA: carboxypeptidase-like regulatory domain-containing protein [Pyrinomonadaceae bacterium]|jgi:hypothetical protein